jgi:hypothetical protein
LQTSSPKKLSESLQRSYAIWEIFGQMCVNLAVMGFKANKQKAVKMALEHYLQLLEKFLVFLKI